MVKTGIIQVKVLKKPNPDQTATGTQGATGDQNTQQGNTEQNNQNAEQGNTDR